MTWLRGVAATYVVINHTRGALFVGGEKLLASDPSLLNRFWVALLQFTSLGVEMVILFFVLSGFAMAHSLSRNPGVGLFYARRAVRIWPPYLAACAFAAAIGMIVNIRLPWQNLFYLEPWTHLTPQFWSLPYEVIFYALCPFILGRRLLPIAALITLAAVIVAGPLLNPFSSALLNFAGTALLLFAIGATAHRYVDRIPVVSGRTLALLAAITFVSVLAIKHLLGGSNLYSNLIVAAFTVLAIKNLPENLPFDLGEFSYSIYIFHYAMVLLLAWTFGPSANPLLWVLAVPPIIGTCFCLYWITERPANKLVARLRVPDLSCSRLDDSEVENDRFGQCPASQVAEADPAASGRNLVGLHEIRTRRSA